MIDIYGSVFRNALFPAWESVIRRRPTLGLLEKLERSQWSSLDELVAMQGDALTRLVRHADEKVPYYRDRFESIGLRPEDVQSAADITRLPLLTRDEARESFERRKSVAAPLMEISKMTSGTTGQPLEFGYDRGSEYFRQATKLRGYGWSGYRPGDKSLHFWGMLDYLYDKPFFTKKKLQADRFLRRELYMDCTDRSPQNLDRVVEAIIEHRPKVLICYAQAAVALARHVLEHDARDWDVLPVISAAEPLLPADRAHVEAAFGAVFESYGSREFMLIGMECGAHAGMHLSMENLLVELVVREGGRVRPAEPGEEGEVVVTDLHNFGVPFIRYLTGDLAVRQKPERCACGRSLERVAAVTGRANDTLHDGEGRPVSGMFFAVTFSVLAHKVREFQAIQRRDRSLDIKLVPTAAFDDSLIATVLKNCSKALPGVPVRIEVVDRIPVGKNGKLRPVMVEH